MQNLFFIIHSPSITFTKSDLYVENDQIELCGEYIKAISDAFFLSNNFRKNLNIDFFTVINEEEYIISFDGSRLKYLGPSFFSATHLLLRAINHTIKPYSKSGKLTPGITVEKGGIEVLEKKYQGIKKIQIVEDIEISQSVMNLIQETTVFLFGFENSFLDAEKISFGRLSIDEQIIITNFYLERETK